MSILCLGLAAVASASLAAPPVVSAVTVQADRTAEVELLAVNDGATARTLQPPAQLVARLRSAAGMEQAVTLERQPGEPATIPLAVGGFVRLHYRFVVPPGMADQAMLVLPNAPAVALAIPASAGMVAQVQQAGAAPPSDVAPGAPPAASADNRRLAEDRGRSAFLANLSSYQPIYAVYGPGTDSDARIQVSLQYQFFGTPGQPGSWIDGFTFGYTQRMFWDLGRNSSPFRNVDYMPELFYAVPARPIGGDWTIGGRAGFRHQSNGRSGDASRSFNILYLEPEAATRWHGLDVAFGPRAWVYVGRRSDNPDIAHYYGNAGLYARVGTADGVQLDLTGRLNPGSGKGALDALVSYPLTALWSAGPKLYLFAQGFAGYGETSLDYDRRQTRLRLGIGFTR